MMKKIFILILLSFIAMSCNDDNPTSETPSATPPNPELLSKIIFSPGTVSERYWNVYPNGLLKEITKPDGTVLQTFTYDSNNNLLEISATTLTNAYTFTYDATNHITSVNGQNVTYDSATNKYQLDYNCTGDCMDSVDAILNSDSYVTKITENWITPGGDYTMDTLSAFFNAGNAISCGWDMSGGSYAYDTHPNPMRLAMASLCKSTGILNFGYNPDMMRWMEGHYMSVNNVIYSIFGDGPMDKYECIYDYNSNNLPQVQYRRDYDESGPLNWNISAQYYYQGDVIP